MWNYFFTMYYAGNAHYRADLLWISRHGLDRSIQVDSWVKQYQGQHPRFREKDGAGDLLTQSLADVLAPSDVAGIVSLSWRYRDAGKRDSVWAYVPALRRVRQVSPANRSDGFLGSDMTQDDGPYFDGKVEDFKWKLVGEQDLLVLFDRPSFEQPARLRRLPGGGWRMMIPGNARVGFQLPGWQGAPWCPVQEVLIRRPHWVVEAVPKDPYYLYGKLVFRFDKDVYLGSYSTKYDWKGNLLSSYAAVRTNLIRVAPGEIWGWAGGAVALALNWKLDRATTAGIVAGEDVPADSRIPLSPSLFSLQRLTERGGERVSGRAGELADRLAGQPAHPLLTLNRPSACRRHAMALGCADPFRRRFAWLGPSIAASCSSLVPSVASSQPISTSSKARCRRRGRTRRWRGCSTSASIPPTACG